MTRPHALHGVTTDLVARTVRDLAATYDRPVTHREIGKVCGLAPSSVHHHLAVLIAAGEMRRCGRRGGVLPAKGRDLELAWAVGRGELV